MSNPLRSGVPRLLGDHSGRRGRWFHQHVQALRVRVGQLDGLAKAQAAAVALFWVQYQTLAEELGAAEGKRTNGTGRRPSAREIQALRKRLALTWSSYERALARLEDMQGIRR